MRQRDPKHEQRLQSLLATSVDDCKRQIAVSDYQRTDYVASEVLATIIRLRYGQSTGILSVATEELHRRIVRRVEILIGDNVAWKELKRNCSEVLVDAVSYFWTKFIEDGQVVCNAEVRFAVYLQNKVYDYMRHLLTEENTRKSVDAMSASDEDGNETEFIDTVEDKHGESPEAAAIRKQESVKNASALMALLPAERHAFYFRMECGYDWKTVAQLLDCSIPTARQHLNRSLEKLQGAMT